MFPGVPDGGERQREVGVPKLGVGLEAPARQDHAGSSLDAPALARLLGNHGGDPFAIERKVDHRGVERDRDVPLAHGGLEHAPQSAPGALAGRGNELAVTDVPGAREVGPGWQHPAERIEVDRRDRPSERLEEVGDAGQPARVRLEHATVGLAEAKGIEVVDCPGTVDLEQEAAGVDAVAATGRGLLDDGDRRAGVVRGDRGGRAGGAEPDDEDVDCRRSRAPADSPMLMGRAGHDPQRLGPVPSDRRLADHRVEAEQLVAALEHLDRMPEQLAAVEPHRGRRACPPGVKRGEAGGLESRDLVIERVGQPGHVPDPGARGDERVAQPGGLRPRAPG